MNNKIKILDEATIAKIAAGEIIERPASIVKELIENSIDAGASNIVIEIKNGGKTYIRVTDDGIGMNEDEVEFAFLRHSTSKISVAEDLLNIHSLGFRGEALASISTTCMMETLTRNISSDKGIRVFLEEGKIIKKEPIGCPEGTTMIAKDLFYNTPVRKKFLKSDLVESNHISDVIYKLALGNPGISFKYIKDSKVILKTPGNNQVKSNIYSVLGKDFIDNLFEISYYDSDLSIQGYISKNDFYRGNRGHQYIFVNGRWIENIELTKIIENCYKSLIPINRFPIFILFIEIEPSLIDVNIHPTKQEIKFSNQNKINNTLKQLVNKKLKDIISIPKIEINDKKNENIEEINFLDTTLATTKVEKSLDEPETYEKDFIKEDDLSSEDMLKSIYFKKKPEQNKKGFNIEVNEYRANSLEEVSDINKKEDLTNIFKNTKLVGILFNTYIILENTVDDYFYLIDQHAAHERIKYEQYKKEYEKEDIAIQRLLSPEIIQLTNKEYSIVKDNLDLFNKLGFEIEGFGLNSVALRGVPLIFGKPQIKELFFDILDNMKSNLNTSYDVKIEKIMKMACTNAIKGGDKITKIEIEELLNQLAKANSPYTCPHGRPIIIKVTKRDLEKKFKRII